jgi:hypothetical protein
MTEVPGMRRSVALFAALALVVTAAVSSAQTSSGRHRAPREMAPTDADSVARRDDGPGWYLMAGAGLMTSGDLVRYRTEANTGIAWDPPAGEPFLSDDFTLTLDEGVALSLAMGRRLSRPLWLRLDLSAAELPVTALARTGQSVEPFRWDELSVVVLGLSAEYRLVNQPSFLFLNGGGGMTWTSGNRSDDLDRTQAHLRLGGGYHQDLGRGWGVRAEIRDSIQDLDGAAYRPPVEPGADYPAITVTGLGPQHLVEVLLLVNGRF